MGFLLLFLAGTLVFFEAQSAQGTLAIGTDGETRRTDRLVANPTRLQTSLTDRLVAAATIRDAFFAVILLTPFAPGKVVRGGRTAAPLTTGPVPIVQGHVGRIRVVVREYGLDEQEEVAEPSPGQGRVNGGPAVAFAEAFFAYVRMGDV
jgi:hypothetical protein